MPIKFFLCLENVFSLVQYWRYTSTVQSRFSEIKFSDNLWFSDYFAKTIFPSYEI